MANARGYSRYLGQDRVWGTAFNGGWAYLFPREWQDCAGRIAMCRRCASALGGAQPPLVTNSDKDRQFLTFLGRRWRIWTDHDRCHRTLTHCVCAIAKTAKTAKTTLALLDHSGYGKISESTAHSYQIANVAAMSWGNSVHVQRSST